MRLGENTLKAKMMNNFKAAQRAYDNMLPPEYVETVCPACDGAGTIEDVDGPEPCRGCTGTGVVEVSADALRKARRDEARMDEV